MFKNPEQKKKWDREQQQRYRDDARSWRALVAGLDESQIEALRIFVNSVKGGRL